MRKRAMRAFGTQNPFGDAFLWGVFKAFRLGDGFGFISP